MTAEPNNKTYQKKMTPSQEVSNRSILRIQQLSEEFLKEIGELQVFKDGIGPIKEVLFAARDHGFEQGTEALNERWYNFRLTGNFDFSKADRKWIRIHYHLFEPFFDLARINDPGTAARFEKFKDGVELWGDSGETPDPKRSACEQFFIALAVIPYRNVLPTLLEKAFGLDVENPGASMPSCLLFSSPKQAEISFQRFDQFILKGSSPIGSGTMDALTLATKGAGREQREQVIERQSRPSILTEGGIGAILEFTRGKETGEHGETDVFCHLDEHARTLGKETSERDGNPDEDLRGLAVPAYDYWCKDSNKFLGGMAGWIVILLEKDVYEFCQNAAKISKEKAETAWSHFVDLMRAYVRRVREASLRDLLEDYAHHARALPPGRFLEENLHQVIGWKKAEDDEEGCEHGNRSSFRLPLEKGEMIAFDVCRLRDTRELTDPAKPFPPGTRRLCRLFFDQLELIQMQRKKGADRTVQSFFHQIRNMGESIGGKWLVKPTSQEKTCIEATMPDLRSHLWKIAPIPEAFESVAACFGVWGNSEVFASCEQSLSVWDSMVAAIDTAQKCLLMTCLQGDMLEYQERREGALRALEDLGEARREFENALEKNGCKKGLQRLCLSDSRDAQADIAIFKRLLVRIAEESMRHAIISSVHIEMTGGSDKWSLRWRNQCRAGSSDLQQIDKTLDRLLSGKASRDLGAHFGFHGKSVLEHLVEEMGGYLSRVPERDVAQHFIFLANDLRIKIKAP